MPVGTVHFLLSPGFLMTLSTAQAIQKQTKISRVNNKLGRNVESSSGQQPVLGSSDHDNESSGSIKGREHLKQLNGLQIAPWG